RNPTGQGASSGPAPVPPRAPPNRRLNFLRGGHHALLLAPPARPDVPRRIGLAGRRRVGPARGGPPPAARRIPPRPAHPAHVAANGGVRGAARSVAAQQRRRSRPVDQRPVNRRAAAPVARLVAGALLTLLP